MADAGKPLQGKAVLNSAERDELALLRRRMRQFEQEPDHPGRGCGLVRQQGRQDVHRVYELANANQADAKVATMCRMRVSTSGCCTGRDRALSPTATDNTVPAEHIRHTLADSHQTCGMARMRAELRDQGPAVSRKRAARLVCIRAISLRRGLTGTAHRHHGQDKAPEPARGGPTPCCADQLNLGSTKAFPAAMAVATLAACRIKTPWAAAAVPAGTPIGPMPTEPEALAQHQPYLDNARDWQRLLPESTEDIAAYRLSAVNPFRIRLASRVCTGPDPRVPRPATRTRKAPARQTRSRCR